MSHSDSNLLALRFTDIYLGEKSMSLAGIPGTKDPIPAPEECFEELTLIRKNCLAEVEKKPDRQDFMLRFTHKDAKYIFRVSILKSLTETVFVLRRLPEVVPDFADSGLHPGLQKLLLTPNLTGLIVVSGAVGQGKTTTASSLTVARLKEYGGVGVTIEDPPEQPLEGRHGEGVCYQTWAERGEFGHACRQASRWSPSIIYLGEVRDAETAAEALRASINGRLVICTSHADSIPTAIERLYNLANGVVGTSEDVASLLSDGLVAVLHQNLEGDAAGHKQLKSSFLWLGGEDSKGIRTTIRNRLFSQINSEVQRQLNMLLMGKK